MAAQSKNGKSCLFSLVNNHFYSSLLLQWLSALANHASVIKESARLKNTVCDLMQLKKQRKLAEMLQLKADAEEQGKDVERQKNWKWAIKKNEEWEKKLMRKAQKADFEFHGMFLPPSSLVSSTLLSIASSRQFTCCMTEIQEGCR